VPKKLYGKEEKMESLKPGEYKFSDGNISYRYVKEERFPHRLFVSVGINGEAVDRAARGIDLVDAIKALDRNGREFTKRKAEQLVAVEVLQGGFHAVEDQFKAGKLSLDQAGQKIQRFVGDFICSHKENLPETIHVAPDWRVNTETNSLQRPWKVDRRLPEPYEVWFVNRGLIASALERKVKRVVL
jgi:hypothetical protein